MGVLDDAIREHLELKRKHGVPEEEVERQEEEALGPARREVAQQPDDAELTADEATPAPAAAGDGPTAPEDAALFDGEHRGAPPADEPPVADHAPAPAEPPVADHTGMEPPPVDDVTVMDPSVTDEPALEPDPHEPLGDTEPHGFPAVDHDEEPGEDDDLLASEPEEEPEPEIEPDPEQDDLDVLEDTPDFLQETPEHDRLWFEQKPPRDFDFD